MDLLHYFHFKSDLYQMRCVLEGQIRKMGWPAFISGTAMSASAPRRSMPCATTPRRWLSGWWACIPSSASRWSGQRYRFDRQRHGLYGTRTLQRRRHRHMHRSHLRAHLQVQWRREKAYPAVPPLDERHGRAHEPDHQGIHDQGLRARGAGAATGACPGLRPKLQLRQALEGAQVEDTIAGDLRGMGKRSKPLWTSSAPFPCGTEHPCPRRPLNAL